MSHINLNCGLRTELKHCIKIILQVEYPLFETLGTESVSDFGFFSDVGILVYYYERA